VPLSTFVIFDVDGVLIDSREAVRQAYASVDIVVPEKAWGISWREWLPEMVESESRAKKLHVAKNEAYPGMIRKFARELPPIKTLRELLMLDVRVGILTAASLHAARMVSIHLGIHRDVEFIGTECRNKVEVLARLSDKGQYVDDHDQFFNIKNFDKIGWRFIHYVPTMSSDDLMEVLEDGRYHLSRREE
tara:strand:+ start:3610 stop:4179 length:570 start_codon:yes stop_codon:yes gene_type:complete